MDQGFFTRPLGLWLLTLALAVALLGLGYELAQRNLEPQLMEAKSQLAAETSRANRLAAENQRLESRLTQAEAQLASRPGPPPRHEPDSAGEGEPAASRVLHRGEAAVLLEGRLVLALDGFSKDRRQAQLTARVLGGQEATASLAPGGDLTIRLEERAYRLVLKKILANSIVYTLRPAEGGPGPRRGQ